MKPVTKLYAKMFTGFSILFGVFSGIPAILMAFSIGVRGEREKLLVLVVTALVVLAASAIVAVGVAALKVYDIKKLGFAVTDASLSVRQEKAVVLSCDHAEALERCTAAIRALPRAFLIGEATFEEGILHARTGMTLNSMGDKIQLRVRPRNAGSTIVTVSSRPRYALAFLDQARNLKNVEKIVHLLQHPANNPHPNAG